MNAQRLLVTGVVATAALLSHLPSARAQSGYKAYREESDVTIPGFTQYFDAKLVQPWGLATDHNPCYMFSFIPCKTNAPPYPVGSDATIMASVNDQRRIFWVADSDSHYVTVYDDTGAPLASGGVQLAITVPGTPTGIVVNPYCAPTLAASSTAVTYTTACNHGALGNISVPFAVAANGRRAAAEWLTASRDGRVYAWNPDVNLTGAVTVIDDYATGADYTGIAVAPDASMIVLSDFKNGALVAYDSAYNRMSFYNAEGHPRTLEDTNIPAGFAPSNATFITYPNSALGTHLYVTYGRKSAPYANVPEIVGPAAPTVWVNQPIAGYVSDFVLGAGGTFTVQTMTAPADKLNAPWAVTLAPTLFGVDASTSTSFDLYVGNFGDGYINVFNPATDSYVARLGEAVAEIVPPANSVPGYPTVGSTTNSPVGQLIWEPGLRGLAFKKVYYQVTPVPLSFDWANRLFFNANLNFNVTVPSNEWSIFGFIRPT
jgi:uncharacterized protein (TIGR03118 family)